MQKHIATILAYERKDGGFRGVFAIKGKESEKEESRVFPTLEEAKVWAKQKAKSALSHYTIAPIYRNGEYYANLWAI